MTINISSSQFYRHFPKNDASPFEGDSRELAGALQKIVQNVVTLLEVDTCSVALLDAEKKVLVTLTASQKQGLQSHDSHFQESARDGHFQESEGVGRWVAEYREALISNDVSLDPRFIQTGQVLAGSMACVPLIDKQNFIGTLTASSSETGAFSPQKLNLLTIFAEHALTIINARQAESALQDATRMKANFLSMITHELRSPLNAINGYLDLALEGMAGELNEQQREFVQRARAGSEHLYALVEDLLLIERADAGQLRLNREMISIQEIVTNAVEELEMIARDNGITTKIDIADDFPQIYADAVRMQQVLRNLISNAIRFTPPEGGVTISARVSSTVSTESSKTSENQRLIEVQVRDTGYGMEPEYQERIFERFYQIPIVNAGRPSGLGLGLAIVKMLVELHGGRVTVESKPNAGSAFKFTLPLLFSE